MISEAQLHADSSKFVEETVKSTVYVDGRHSTDKFAFSNAYVVMVARTLTELLSSLINTRSSPEEPQRQQDFVI